MIDKELENSFFSISSIKKIFSHIDLESIRNVVKDVLTKYQYFLDDYSFTNYIMHIAIMIELNQNQQEIYQKSEPNIELT